MEEAPFYQEEELGPRVGDSPLPRRLPEDEARVAMRFPHAVNLQHEGVMYRFGPGVHQVKITLASHPYLKYHGVVAV